jgi:hypothetical protein
MKERRKYLEPWISSISRPASRDAVDPARSKCILTKAGEPQRPPDQWSDKRVKVFFFQTGFFEICQWFGVHVNSWQWKAVIGWFPMCYPTVVAALATSTVVIPILRNSLSWYVRDLTSRCQSPTTLFLQWFMALAAPKCRECLCQPLLG